MSAVVSGALLAATLLGLVVRRRGRLLWSFTAYVVATLASDVAVGLHFERLHEFHFYAIKETVLVVLKIAVALEIAHRAFASLPRARTNVLFAMAAVLSATAAATLAVPADVDHYSALIGTIAPRQQAGALWLFAVVGAAVAWYRVPLHPLHRAGLIGFSAYGIVWTAALALMGALPGARWAADLTFVANAVAYSSAAALWAWAAWRPVHAPEPVLSMLQPWARSW